MENIKIEDDICIWNCDEYSNIKFYQVIKISEDKTVSFNTNIESNENKHDLDAWFLKAKDQITKLNLKLFNND